MNLMKRSFIIINSTQKHIFQLFIKKEKEIILYRLGNEENLKKRPTPKQASETLKI